MSKVKRRRLIAACVVLVAAGLFIFLHPANYQPEPEPAAPVTTATDENLAINALKKLLVKPNSAKEKYVRKNFGNGWGQINGCDTRNVILQRDMTDTKLNNCLVMSGVLNDPYTGKVISFVRGAGTSSAVQIDHVVALSNAWQTGASEWDTAKRVALANDPLELLAVDGPANQQKSDKDASAWLPSNKGFICHYVARQITVKAKYHLWVTQPEHDTMSSTLAGCPGQKTISFEK